MPNTSNFEQQRLGQTGSHQDDICAGASRALEIARIRLAGDDDDRHYVRRRVPAQEIAELVPINARHTGVGDDNVVMTRQRLYEPIAAIVSLVDIASSELQIPSVQLSRIFIPIDQQHTKVA